MRSSPHRMPAQGKISVGPPTTALIRTAKENDMQHTWNVDRTLDSRRNSWSIARSPSCKRRSNLGQTHRVPFRLSRLTPVSPNSSSGVGVLFCFSSALVVRLWLRLMTRSRTSNLAKVLSPWMLCSEKDVACLGNGI